MIKYQQSKYYQIRNRRDTKQLFVWGVLWALTYLLLCNAASVSATSAPGMAAIKPAALPHNSAALAPAATALTATKQAALVVDNARAGVADPGDTLEYTVIITSIGSSDATSVAFSDTPDANTTLVGGSISASPVTVDDTYPQTVIGNVSINSALIPYSVVSNDFPGVNPATVTISAFDATSVRGGQVVMTTSGGGIGQFTYNPPPGYTGADSFTYTLNNANGSSVGTVNLTISGMVWFINNGAAACTTLAAGCGRLSNPFSTLAAFNTLNNGAGNNPAANDNIFVYESATSYLGGVTLLSGQKLIGQDSTSTLATITGLTPPSGSAAFPTMNTGGNATTIGNGAGNGVTLNSSNTLNGFTAGTASSSAISGSGCGTLTVADVIVNTTGQALNLTNGTLAATFASVTSSGGTNNVALAKGAGVLAGTLTMSGGALSGTSGNAFDVNGGTATISYAGTIGNSAARSVNIANMTGGTTTFSGAVSGTGTGINLATNTGATINFTGGINLSTGANAAFTATGGGTVNATQNNTTIVNTLATTTGTALNVANTTIGASGLTFRSISAGTSGSGPTNGIILNTTGSTGGLSVTGTGTTVGSGGTIQKTVQGALFTSTSNLSLKNMNFTNANSGNGTCSNIDDATFNNACQGAINMSSVTTVAFDNLSMTNPAGAGAQIGINGQTVSDFTLSNTTIDKFGDAVNENDVRLFNLTGTCAFTNDTFSLAAENAVDIRNNTGTLTLTVQGSPLGSAFTTFNDTQSSATGGALLSVTAKLSANINLTVKSSKFLKMKTAGIQTFARDTSSMNVDIVGGGVNANGNTFDPQGGLGRSVDLNAEDTAHLNFNVNNNPKMYGNGGPNINVFGINNAVIQGRINSNPDIRAGGNGASGSAINVHPEDNSTAMIEMLGNTISGVGNDPGIFAFSHGDGGANHSATLDVTIQSNTITISSTNPGGVPGIDTRAGSNAGDTIKTCVDVMNNAVTLGSGGSDVGWLTREGSNTAGDNLYLEGMIAGASNSARAVNTWNARGNTPSGSAVAVDASGAAAYTAPPAGAPYNGVCRQPTNPTATLPMLNINQGAALADNAANHSDAQASNALLNSENAFSFPSGFTNLFKQSAWLRPHDATATFTTASITGEAQGSPVPQSAAAPLSAPVSVVVGTLNPGKSVTIKFRVMLNLVWPAGIIQVSNQGQVTSNIATLNTDDPSTPTPNDPTITSVPAPNPVYVNASWAGTPLGTDPDGAGPAFDFGFDSFATIQGGIDAVAGGGTVHVAGGTYGESPNLNRNASVQTDGNISLNGGLTLASGTWNAGSATLSLTGNWTKNGGAFSAGSGTVIFNKAGTQALTGNTTFNNLTIAVGATVDTGSAIATVNGTFTNNGVMKREAQAQDVSLLGSVVYLDGRGFTTARLTQSSLPNLGSTSVSVVMHQTPASVPCGATPLIGSQVLRYYDITPSVSSGVSLTLRLYYDPVNELNGNVPANLGVLHCDGTNWVRIGDNTTTGSDGATGLNYVQVTGVTSFSPFAIGNITRTFLPVVSR